MRTYTISGARRVGKLGRKAKREDARTLQFRHYRAAAAPGALPAPPTSFAWSKGLQSWGMMLNDSEGDCTCAEAGHQVQLWTMNAGPAAVTIPDEAVQAAYVAVTGMEGHAYDPATGANDNGCVILDVLNYWRQVGVGGHKILAFLAINLKNRAEVLEAGELFGGLKAGVQLPLTAQAQVGGVWDVPAGGPTGRGAPGSWGGHDTLIVDANATGPVAVTWGALQQMTWAFWETYYDEAYAVLSQDWIDASGVSASGFDLATLTADLAAITGQPLPVPPPAPTPPSGPAAQVVAADQAAFAQLLKEFSRVRGAAAALSQMEAALEAKHKAILAAAQEKVGVKLNWLQILQDVQTLIPIIEQFAPQRKAA